MSISVTKVNVAPYVAKSAGQAENGVAASAVHPSFGMKTIEINDKGRAFKFVNWLGEDFNSAWQRGVSGATALLTQPFFDLRNKKVDEKTRQTSCARTTAKIIAGTLTGVGIRELFIKASAYFTQNIETDKHLVDIGKKTVDKIRKASEFKPIEQCLLPEQLKNTADYLSIKKFRGSVGTFVAVAVMVFTNFLIDAPLTTFLTNKFNKMFTAHNEKQQNLNAVDGGKQ